MATTRIRRAGANPPNYAIDEDGDRVYTEDDYAAQADHALPDEWAAEPAPYAAGWTGEEYLPDEAFQPDEEDDLPEGEWAAAPEDGLLPYDGVDGYVPLFDREDDFDDDELDPLDDELLTDEERAELKRSHWQLISGLADFAGVILGTAAILVLVTLLVSLLNWLVNDMSQSFILLQKNL